MYNESLAAVKTAGPALSGLSQEACIEKMAQGDKEALRALYEQTKSAVYGFALSILKNPCDAEDVLQETFIKAYTSAHAYQPRGKPMAWILTITRNLALMKMRQERKRAGVPWEDCERILGDSPAVTRDDMLVLRAAIGTLSDTELQVVMLHTVSGFKHREIAALLGCPISTVLSKHSRALQKLKAQLAQEESL